jgi:LmbE family N-acetylglucosaminyl deacetylase
VFNKLKVKIINYILKSISSAFLLKPLTNLNKYHNSEHFFNQLPLFDSIAPREISLSHHKRVLVLSPHPDDDIFGAGGSLIFLAKNSATIKTLYLTHGATSPGQTQFISQEIITVSKELGSTYDVWDVVPGNLDASEINIGRLSNLIINFKPDLIILPFITDSHDDHVMTNKILYRVFQNEKLFPRAPIQILAFQIYGLVPATCYVDITKVIHEKIKLINVWKSINGNRNWAHYIKGLNALNSRYKPTKEEIYLETFYNTDLLSYIELIGKVLP